MTPAQLRRLETNVGFLRAIEQNLDALYSESHDAGVRRAQELVLRALDQLNEVGEQKVA